MAVVCVENLTRTFGRIRALDGLTFSVDQGEIFGLIGPDGSGKTTCLRILCGLMAPTSGRAAVLDKDVAAEPELIKEQVGYMAQPAKLYEELTVKENIEFYADLYEVPRESYKQRMNRLLQFSGLAPFTDRLFRDLSGGMKQKVGLTCCLIHKPAVLLLDEPTNGVDPVSRRDFWKILYELKREKVTMVVASTYLDEADRCHRVAFFEKGRGRMVMTPLELRKLLKDQLFNLTVTDRRKALDCLKTIHIVLNPYVFGTGIHFLLKESGDISAVESELHSSGLGDITIERIRPSLEDVYLFLLDREAKQE